jgi:hypothetical protein
VRIGRGLLKAFTVGIQQKHAPFAIVTDSGERRRLGWWAFLEGSVHFEAVVWNAHGQDAREVLTFEIPSTRMKSKQITVKEGVPQSGWMERECLHSSQFSFLCCLWNLNDG